MAARADDDQEFLKRADAFMAAVLAQLDAFDPDELEADLAMGVLKIAFPDGRTCVMNRQTAAHQIWLAEGATAWHFAFDATQSRWIDTKGRGDLWSVLSGVLQKRLGRPVRLDAAQ
jgi:CyaY protein